MPLEQDLNDERFDNQEELSARLDALHGKTLVDHTADGMSLTLTFSDGTTLRVPIWDDFNEREGFDRIEFEK